MFGSAPGVAVVRRAGRIAVVDRKGERWRSHGRFRIIGTPRVLTGLALGAHSLAFSFDTIGSGAGDALYVAPLAGRERRVTGEGGESPLGWTPAGALVTSRYLGGESFRLLLRAPWGALLGTLANRARVPTWDPATRSALFVAAGWLMRSAGASAKRMADVRPLGLAAPRTISLLRPIPGGGVGLRGGRSVLTLGRDGALRARTRLPRGSIQGDGLIPSPDGSMVAFAVIWASPGGRRASIAVEVLGPRPGPARQIADWQVRSPGTCAGVAVSLRWRGRWLLASDGLGTVLAARASGAGGAVDLSAAGRALAGADTAPAAIDARWG
ncbi:MAG: hypothetical protein QOK40_1772 [Miltoncostaeaceae bacterium]|nr:hypothetical protein [Miltoncostaeaceae bacterium]